MLESYPAMDQVLDRLLSLPPAEQGVWGLFLSGLGWRLQRRAAEPAEDPPTGSCSVETI
ncbi:MAG: hypothetical protein K2X82_15140 [Gemmataceae bacterium]|nr:hypothetical protein [Gemmataceae bacterium]